MHDIKNQADIKLLLDTFHSKVKQDDIIGFIFNDIIGASWDKHLPMMYKFWDMALLSKPGYEGHPTRKHTNIDEKIPLKKEHFDRWVYLWNETIDSLFRGQIATQAKDKAMIMAYLINKEMKTGRKP